MSSKLELNTTSLESLLVAAQALPEYIDTVDATAVASDILSGETAYTNCKKVTGTMPNNGDVGQTIDGLEIQSVEIPEGYTSGGTIALDDTIDNTADAQAAQIEEIMTLLEGKTYDSASLQKKTVTPTSSNQVITADSGYQGLSQVTVNGDANLVAENIAEGVSVFGVTGTHSGGAEQENVTLTFSYRGSYTPVLFYSHWQSGKLYAWHTLYNDNVEYEIAKNSIIFINFYDVDEENIRITPSISGGITEIDGHDGISGSYAQSFDSHMYLVNGDCTLDVLCSYDSTGGSHD